MFACAARPALAGGRWAAGKSDRGIFRAHFLKFDLILQHFPTLQTGSADSVHAGFMGWAIAARRLARAPRLGTES
ncbi:protein of unknown function [Rhodovastum atsumiense]|nr:protein of unknown function [Rhodovastum atsumiense]